MAFVGMESLNSSSLNSVKKKQNKVEEYREVFDQLHRRGILTFTKLMFAFDKDANEYYETLPQKLDEVGVSVILPSISIPIYGTPFYNKAKAEGRLLDNNILLYEGVNCVFQDIICARGNL